MTPYRHDMAKPRLKIVPPAPLTVLERYAVMADEAHQRAQALAKQVAEMEVALRQAKRVEAALQNALSAHNSGDEALLDEALARLREIASE